MPDIMLPNLTHRTLVGKWIEKRLAEWKERQAEKKTASKGKK
jgi:hypothetical protein